MRYIKLYDSFYQDDNEDIESCFVDALDLGFELNVKQNKIFLKLPITHEEVSNYNPLVLRDVTVEVNISSDNIDIKEYGNLTLNSGKRKDLIEKDENIIRTLINCATKLLLLKDDEKYTMYYKYIGIINPEDFNMEFHILCQIVNR